MNNGTPTPVSQRRRSILVVGERNPYTLVDGRNVARGGTWTIGVAMDRTLGEWAMVIWEQGRSVSVNWYSSLAAATQAALSMSTEMP